MNDKIQINNNLFNKDKIVEAIFNMRFKISNTKSQTEKSMLESLIKDLNNLDSIKIDELSCRPRTVTNVGLD